MRLSLVPAARHRLIFGLIVPVIAVGAVLRIVLHARFDAGPPSLARLSGTLAVGAVADLLTALVVLTPLRLAALLRPWRRLVSKAVTAVLLALYFAVVVFEGFVEYFYFEEFDARFNNIAVDYVLYPDEVVGNVFESYDVPLFAGLALAGGALIAYVVARHLPAVRAQPAPWSWRAKEAARSLALGAGSFGALYAMPGEWFADRVHNEIACDGLVQLVRAYASAELDYPLYYRTLPAPEARERAAIRLGFPPLETGATTAPPSEFLLEKRVGANAPGEPPSQIVVVLEESLGSEFVGSLGHARKPCTPNLERWMPRGLTLTNLTANGNRTVRGLEGVLCSFVPLPGDAIVKRERSDGVASIAGVLAAQGYRTAFFYGGYGVFDEMKPFALASGYQEFVEQDDFPGDAFRTIWGVADEYIFDALLAAQVRARSNGEKLFATLLSVSNHKPYAIPGGRVDWPADDRKREGAVRYADWSLGRYFDRLEASGLLERTLVLVVGDHGARVYGSERIPTASYRIPALFLTPDTTWRGKRIDRLCSQIDLAPTLLALAGVPTLAPFLGESVLALPPDGGRAFVQHNRDVGILTDDALVVLGLKRTVAYYRRAGRDSDEFSRVYEGGEGAELRALADDAAAVFGTAYELYDNGRFRLPADLGGAAPATALH